MAENEISYQPCVCGFSENVIYIKVKQYLRPVLAPLTQVDALEYELQEKTGWRYVPVQAKYCPMCGKHAATDSASKNGITPMVVASMKKSPMVSSA